MTIENIKKMINGPEYDFLRTNEHLGKNIILLGLGGSHSYGTNVETSDLDVRGCYINSKKEILLGHDSEQVCNEATDTTLYSFKKFIKLLSSCNPNVCEMLGLKHEHYLYISQIGQELLDNSKLFLSKKAINTFGGYAEQQLYRLKQLLSHNMKQNELEEHIFKTLQSIQNGFNEHYTSFDDDNIKLYIDKSPSRSMDTEIFMDVNLTHYPVRDYCGMWAEFQNTIKNYNKIGSRNSKAIEHGKITKHGMHLIRLYLMCLDILEKEEIITYREVEHDLLMDIRNGKFMTNDGKPTDGFWELLKDLEKRFEYAKENTNLPDEPDYNKINEFVMSVNERIVKGEIQYGTI